MPVILSGIYPNYWTNFRHVASVYIHKLDPFWYYSLATSPSADMDSSYGHKFKCSMFFLDFRRISRKIIKIMLTFDRYKVSRKLLSDRKLRLTSFFFIFSLIHWFLDALKLARVNRENNEYTRIITNTHEYTRIHWKRIRTM